MPSVEHNPGCEKSLLPGILKSLNTLITAPVFSKKWGLANNICDD
jgi:hypothetical protein